MARMGKIDRLAPELREELARRREGGHTLDELVGWLRTRGVQIGRTAVFNHVRKLDAAAREIRRGRQRAEAILARLGERGPHDAVAALNLEALQAAILELLAEHAGGQAPLAPQDVHRLAEALAKLASAARANHERQQAVRLEAAGRAARQAAKAARSEGLRPEVIQRIREAVLGTMPPAHRAASSTSDR